MAGKEKKSGFFGEFKKFISRGNVLDMAVGLVMGSAFTSIVNSLVDDIIMPLLGVVIGGVDFTSLSVTLGSGDSAPVLTYGNLIQNIINFLAIALVLFLIVKGINKVHERSKKEEEPAAPEKPDDVKLLEEIRDLMKDKKAG
ncbi:MAG: large-conductance mechanosensitive channel protein MscL [Oscillospiraceae bacterium]|jgi:large conductance mechanosensitive channel